VPSIDATCERSCLVIRPSELVGWRFEQPEGAGAVNVGRFVVRTDRPASGFVVRTDGSASGFVVVGPGVGAVDACEFLVWLRRHGRGSYTQRTYALGLAHFLSWIDAGGVELGDVD
jgi:hypothetical protein